MTKILITVFAMMSVTISTGSWVARNSGASLVLKDAGGGHVLLHGAYMPAMGDARLLMAEHCRGAFEYQESAHAVEFRCKAREAATLPAAAELALRTDAP